MRDVNVMMTAAQREVLEAFTSDSPAIDTVGTGGSRFGGKTFTGAWCIGLEALKYRNSRTLALRTVLRAADLNMGEEIKKAFLEPMGIPVGNVRKGEAQYLEKEKRFLFPNGSMIQLGFCLKPNDWEQHQGVQWDKLWLAEATQFPERVIEKLGASVRPSSNTEGCPSRKLLDFNPGGLGAEWVERRVVNPLTRDRRTIYVKQTVRDSLATLERDPGYILRELMKIADPVLRAQWLEGDWDAQSGIYFRLVPPSDDGPGTVCSMTPAYWSDWYGGTDWGYHSPFAYLVGASWMDDKNRPHLHIAGEVYQSGLDMDQQAELALQKEAELKKAYPLMHALSQRMADPATSAPLEKESGEQTRTVALVWLNNGFITYPSPRYSRIARWNLIRSLIRHGILTIDPSCRALIKELKGAVREEEGEDIDQKRCPDHALDALAYLVCRVFGLDYQAEDQVANRYDLDVLLRQQ